MNLPEFIAEVESAIHVYESAIGNFASHTRQMIDRLGAVEALAKLVRSPDLQSGFKVLRDQNKLDKTFESVVVRHPDLFQDQVVEAAQWRLDNADELL